MRGGPSRPCRSRSGRSPADVEIFKDHDHPDRCCLLLDGFMHRYKILPDGGRQIMSFHTPGDFVDLQSLHLGTMDHSTGTLVQSRVAFVRMRRFLI